MAGRPRKPNKTELQEEFNPDARSPSNRSSTLGVDRAIANRIREMSHEYGISVIDLTNRMLEFAMEKGRFTFEVRRPTISFDDPPPKKRGG